MKYKLRLYQKQASDAAVQAFQSKSADNGILILPTGGGKSLIIADIASRIDSPLLVMQPSKEILEQNVAKLKSYGIKDCGVFSASVGVKEIRRITYATIGTVVNEMDRFRCFKHCLWDECHQGVNPKGGQAETFIHDIPDRQVIGLTATPYRLGRGLDGTSILKFLTRTRPRIFNKVLYCCQVSDLLSQGFLAHLNYYDCTTLDMGRVISNSTGADYDDKSLKQEYIRSHFHEKLTNTTMRVLRPKNGIPRKGVLVFTRYIEEAQELTQSLLREGVKASIVTGDTPKREREFVIENFKSGKIKVVANVGTLTCLDTETEILTREGWKGVDTIKPTDHVAQYDNGEITFNEPLRIIKKRHVGDFVKVEGRYMNVRITDDHFVIYKKKARVGLSEQRRTKARNLVGQNIFLPVSGECAPEPIKPEQPSSLCSRRRFINYNAYNYRKKGMSYEDAELYERRTSLRYKKPNELTLDECLFIGFWLGDGTCIGGRYSVTQSLRTPKMCGWIEDLLQCIGIRFTACEYDGKQTMVNGRLLRVCGYKTYNLPKGTGGDGQEVKTNLTQLLPYLKKGGTDLYWGLSKEQVVALCKGLFMADGWHGDMRKPNSICFCSADKPLIDLLQAICACRGLCMQISQTKRDDYKVPFFRVSVREAAYHQLVNERLALECNDKSEEVWCVTMPKGTIVTRRGGMVAILGNCGFDYPELDTVILGRPTKSLALYYQMVGRIIRPSKDKDGWVVDLGGNIKRFGLVSDLKISCPSNSSKWAVYSNGRQLTNTIII